MLDRNELWLIHERLLEAVHQQVERGRSDLQFFLITSGTLAVAAMSALQLPQHRSLGVFFALLFFIGGVIFAVGGVSTVRNNKRYYRRLVVKRVLVEEQLGLTRPLPGREASAVALLSVSGIATREKVSTILKDPDSYATATLRPGSSAEWGQILLVCFIIFDGLAAVLLGNILFGCHLPFVVCP